MASKTSETSEWDYWDRLGMKHDKLMTKEPVERGKELLQMLDRLRLAPKYSDLIIKSGLIEFNVHRCIVFSQSSVLEEEYLNGKEISIHYQPTVVKKLIDYLYTGHYEVIGDGLDWFDIPRTSDDTSVLVQWFDGLLPDLTTSLGRLSFHIMMYSLAGILEIAGLKGLSKHHIRASLVENMTFKSFSNAIYKIYDSPMTDEELQEIAVEVTIDHLDELRSKTVENDRMVLDNDLLKENPKFTRDVLIAMMGEKVMGKKTVGIDRGAGALKTFEQPDEW